MSSFAESDLSIISGLTEELARLRGAASAAAAPTLDHEGGADGAQSKAEQDEEDGIEEALERMQSEMEAAKMRAVAGDRAALQKQLDDRDGRAREEREALLSYIEELRSREDEAGEAIRGADFEADVVELTGRGRLERANGEAHADDRATKRSQAPLVAKVIQHVKDPSTMDALLEVQRLDEALEVTERRQGEARGTFLTEASAGTRAMSASGRPPPPGAPSSLPRGKAPKSPPKAPADSLGESLSALNAEIGRLKGIDTSAAAASTRSDSEVSARLSQTEDGRFTVGGRRRVGGVWITVADEARIEGLMGESSGSGAELDDDDDLLGTMGVGYGEGYRPDPEACARLAAIDAALEELGGQHALTNPLTSLEVDLRAAEPTKPALGSDSSLATMRMQRADEAALSRIRDRLADLHSTPSTLPVRNSVESLLLAELLASVRQEAERALDMALGSRPSTARSRTDLS